ncbi:hypothetical protein psal_cds_679 [Pandoravirus salinus]|uniref:Uncharacterized protein n=1 Tax=Pandoravirus salinus TaxID=1349410 RepID=S4W2C3_9VIRU|nr:hypothetical protein psal_cds_679 [Pandoravirus salinus]AGO84612.1 hypothetical protein psal_cds_679 [Pandoravirus salinus]
MALILVASTARWVAIGVLLAAAIAQAHGLCRVVARETLAEKTDDQGRCLFLVALVVGEVCNNVVGPYDDDDSTTSIRVDPVGFRDDDDYDDDDDQNDHARDSDGTAWATAAWVDSAQRVAFYRAHRPGTRVPCAVARNTVRGVDDDGPSPPQRSDPGTGPRVAALCAAAAAVTLVLGCGIFACTLKTACCRRIWRCGRHRHIAWEGDDGDVVAHRLVDSVFG